jgi:hypothetical protein
VKPRRAAAITAARSVLYAVAMRFRHLIWLLPIAGLGLLAKGLTDDSAPVALVDAPVVTAVPSEDSARRVAETVARRNRAERDSATLFVDADGWRRVVAPPPDPRLLKLDPSLLDGREPELRLQLASTSLQPEQAGRAALIARRARAVETRIAAIEALGRAGEAGQRELVALLSSMRDDDPARALIEWLLRPQGEPS